MTAFTAKDLGLAVGMPFLAVVAWLAPESSWPAIARFAAPLAATTLSRSPAALRSRIHDLLGESVDGAAIARELAACEIETNFQAMRDHLPSRWQPNIEFNGGEHIGGALDRGRGVVLWVSHFYFAGLVAKIALFQAGYRAHHLSDPGHGFSGSRFGMRILNPIRTSVEERYLAARVVMSTGGPRGAMRQLLTELKRNGIVSITVRPSGLFPVAVPMFDGHVEIATGAPDLAFASGAALLPVFTVRRGDGVYLVNVEGPIDLTESDRRRAAENAAREYIGRLEPYIRVYPGQWANWISA